MRSILNIYEFPYELVLKEIEMRAAADLVTEGRRREAIPSGQN